MGKYFKFKVALIIALLAVSVWKAWPPEQKINLGLDLQGGMHLVLKAQLDKVPEASRKDATDRIREVIANRIDEFGVTEPLIQKQGIDRLVVDLPGVTNRERALAIIKRTALLEFRLVAYDEAVISKALQDNVAPAGYEIMEMGDGVGSQRILVESTAVLTGDKLVDAGVQFDSSAFNQPIVAIEFNGEGANTFSNITSKATQDYRNDGIPRRLAIILDGKLQSAPQIKEPIPNGKAVITGIDNLNEARETAIVLRAGALPCPITVEEERTVGPTLGKDSIQRSVLAMIVGLLAVVVFVAVYYLIPGMIAVAALLMNVVLMAGCLGIFGFSLSLPGIAGIILTVGMAVDANVLIFERMREESQTGKTVRATISSGYQRAFITILDSNLTTLISGLLLFIFGTGPIKGFAVTLSIGIATSMFTALTGTRVFFDYLTSEKKTLNIHMLSIFKSIPKLDYISKRYWAYALSILLIGAGMFMYVQRGNGMYGIDFTGGTLEQVKFTTAVNIGDVRAKLIDAGIADVQVSVIGEATDNELVIRSKQDETERIAATLTTMVGQDKYEVLMVDKVGPAIGSELRGKAFNASLLALLGICIYVWFRFQFVWGLAGIIALLHDALVVLAAFAITGRELNLPVVAAVLTIVGFSINDTIVIFDRIRENIKAMKKLSLAEVINLSVNQTMSRTIITSTTVFMVVCATFFFGGTAINDFAFAMVVGVISGIYSTVFVASPLLVDWQKKK